MKNKLAALLLLLIQLFIYTDAFSQINYLNEKENYLLSCDVSDKESTIKTQQFLDSLSVMDIIEGKDQFLYDLGMVYYVRYAHWKQEGDYLASKKSFEELWNEYQDVRALWNIAFLEMFYGNCEVAIQTIEKYKTFASKDFKIKVDTSQVNSLYDYCK